MSGNFTSFFHALDDTSAWCLSNTTSISVTRPRQVTSDLCFTIIAVHRNLSVHVLPSSDHSAQEPGPFYPHPLLSAICTALRVTYPLCTMDVDIPCTVIGFLFTVSLFPRIYVTVPRIGSSCRISQLIAVIRCTWP